MGINWDTTVPAERDRESSLRRTCTSPTPRSAPKTTLHELALDAHPGPDHDPTTTSHDEHDHRDDHHPPALPRPRPRRSSRR